MKEKRKNRTILVILIILFLAIFLFPPQTGSELAFIPYSVVNLADNLGHIATINDSDELYCFENQSYFLYLTKDLDLVNVSQKHGALALSPRGYIEYSPVQNDYQSLVWMNPQNEFQKSLHIPGYPYFDLQGERLFLINSQSTGLKEINEEGEVLWEFQYPSILTNLCASADGVFLGWLNGRIHVLNELGQVVFQYDNESSRIGVSYALAYSPESDILAAINGLGPQNLLLFKRRKADFQKPAHIPLESEIRREILMDFSKDGKLLFIEQAESLLLFSLSSHKKYPLPLYGRLMGVAEAAEDNLIFCASQKNEGVYNISVFQKPDWYLGSSQLEKNPVSLMVLGDKLLCLFEDSLVSYVIKGDL